MSKVQITAFTGEYYFLSNYCACPITIDGLTYRSAEDLKNLNIVADMARELVVYRRAGVAMFAGAKAIRDLIEHGRRTYHQRIVHGMRVNYYNIRLAKAMDLLMQAGALAMNERDALRECASRTAAERLFNSLLQ